MRTVSKYVRKARGAVRVKPHMRFRQTLFWDVNPRTLDPDKHARYIIARILDFGNDREVRWMWHRYPKRTIRRVVERSRDLHEKSRTLWSLILR